MSSRNNTTSSNEPALGQPNTSCSLHILSSTAEGISYIFMYCFILMGSFFGNIFIIIIVYEHRDLHKAINYFIVNMAVSDLLFPLIVVPVNITGLATDSWHWRVSGILGSCFCKLFYFSSSVAFQVSVKAWCG